LNPKNISIFSLSTKIELDLLNIKTNERVDSLDIYPHSYLIFNPEKNIYVNNADI